MDEHVDTEDIEDEGTARERGQEHMLRAQLLLRSAGGSLEKQVREGHERQAHFAMLAAIYEELRHGHDQVALHTEALQANTEMMEEHSAALDDMAKASRWAADVRR